MGAGFVPSPAKPMASMVLHGHVSMVASFSMSCCRWTKPRDYHWSLHWIFKTLNSQVKSEGAESFDVFNKSEEMFRDGTTELGIKSISPEIQFGVLLICIN